MVVRRHTTQRARPSGPGVECQLRFGTNYLTGQPDLGDDLIALEAVWWHLRDKLLAEHELSASASPADQVRLGRMAGAQFVLTGSLTAVGDKLQISAHLLDVATRRVAQSAKVTSEMDRLLQPIDKLAHELTDAVNWRLPELTRDQIDKSPEASLYFMRGLGYYYAGMPQHATTQFMKTLAVDAGHARARFWGAMTFLDQDQYDHAKIEFTRFLETFGQHSLAPRAKELLKRCEAETSEPREGGLP